MKRMYGVLAVLLASVVGAFAELVTDPQGLLAALTTEVSSIKTYIFGAAGLGLGIMAAFLIVRYVVRGAKAVK